jgi:hypothetical protein
MIVRWPISNTKYNTNYSTKLWYLIGYLYRLKHAILLYFIKSKWSEQMWAEL